MKQFMRSVILLTAVLGAASVGLGFAAGPVNVERSGPATEISNDDLAQVVKVKNGVVETTRFLNKLSNHVYSVWGDDFRIKLSYEWSGNGFGSNTTTLTDKDFKVENESIEDAPNQGKRVTYRLATRRNFEGGGPKLEVDLVYELLPSQFYIRKWLVLKVSGTGALFIDRLAVESDHWSVLDFRLGGSGQPLFADDLFMGLEFPTSVNTANDSIVNLGRLVGRNVSSHASYTSDPVVIGVAHGNDEVHRAFLQYIKQIRVGPVKPFLLYNTWYDLRRQGESHSDQQFMTEQTAMARLHQLQEHLLKPYNLHLDSFVLDEGWDNVNKLWTIDHQAFPNGFGPLVAALKAAHSRLGMWFGPMGGYVYLHQRIAAGQRIGMEVTTDDRALCLAGKNYSRFFRDRLLYFQRTYGVNFFKYDGISMGCNAFGQGYPPGLFSREWNVQSVIDSANALRAKDPDVFLRIGGRSPWWLRWSNIGNVGGGESCGGDYGYLYMVPTLTPRQSMISCHNMSNYEGMILDRIQFPMSSTEGTGLILGQHARAGGSNESLQDWNDAVVDYLSNGNMVIQLFLTPGLLSPEDWSSLGHSLQWFEANAHPILDNTTMVLGDPMKREPYGYVHYSPAKTIISIRNPFILRRTVTLKLDAKSGFEPSRGAWNAEVVYPYREVLPGTFHFGSALTTELSAYELEVIELQPVKKDPVQVAGLRYAVEASHGSGVDLVVYAPAGSTKRVSIPTAQVEANIRVDGKADSLRPLSDQAALSLHFGASSHPDQPSFTEPSIAEKQGTNGDETAKVSFAVRVPGDFSKTKLALLVEPHSPEAGVSAEARDNDKQAVVKVVQQHAARPQRRQGKGSWYFFILPLSPGRHTMDFTIRMPDATSGQVKLSGWLLGERALASHRIHLTLKPDVSSEALQPDLLPHHSGVERESYRLFGRSL